MIIRNIHCLGQATAMTLTASIIGSSGYTTIGGSQPELLYRSLKGVTNDVFSRMATEYIPQDNLHETFTYLMEEVHSWLPKIGAIPKESLDKALNQQEVRVLVEGLPEFKRPLLAENEQQEGALLTMELVDLAIELNPNKVRAATEYPRLYSLITKVRRDSVVRAPNIPLYGKFGYSHVHLEADLGRQCELNYSGIKNTYLAPAFVCLFGTKGLQFDFK